MKVFLISFVVVFVLCSFCADNAFQQVIDAPQNGSLKSRLELFEKNGIERSIGWNDSIAVDSLIAVAKSYMQTPHRMGGVSHKGIDCSGLVYASFRHFGINLPHSSHEQGRYGKVIPAMDELQKGDLVFFYNSYNSRNLITHTGIYLGDGEMIHTSNTSGVVIISLENSSYWKPRFLFGTRVVQL